MVSCCWIQLSKSCASGSDAILTLKALYTIISNSHSSEIGATWIHHGLLTIKSVNRTSRNSASLSEDLLFGEQSCQGIVVIMLVAVKATKFPMRTKPRYSEAAAARATGPPFQVQAAAFNFMALFLSYCFEMLASNAGGFQVAKIVSSSSGGIRAIIFWLLASFALIFPLLLFQVHGAGRLNSTTSSSRKNIPNNRSSPSLP